MEFSANNHIVKICLQGMAMAEQKQVEEAGNLFLQAWNESSNDFELFIAAHFIAQQQADIAAKLAWLQKELKLATALDNEMSRSSLPFIYSNIAQCYEQLTDNYNSAKHYELATTSAKEPSDRGPFYHGIKANLQAGDFLVAGHQSNYQPEIVMNHIYFTAMINGAGLAAALSKGEGAERVFIIQPTGSFEDDPNVTNKKFPGNPTRSYRTQSSLKIIGEVQDWPKLSPRELQQWRERLANNTGKIIN